MSCAQLASGEMHTYRSWPNRSTTTHAHGTSKEQGIGVRPNRACTRQIPLSASACARRQLSPPPSSCPRESESPNHAADPCECVRAARSRHRQARSLLASFKSPGTGGRRTFCSFRSVSPVARLSRRRREAYIVGGGATDGGEGGGSEGNSGVSMTARATRRQRTSAPSGPEKRGAAGQSGYFYAGN